MPAYSYNEQFVPMILDGSKTQTVRGRRKFPARIGDKLFHFHGLRTQHSQRLRENVCILTHSIVLSVELGIILYDRSVDSCYFDMLRKDPITAQAPFNKKMLSSDDRAKFAWMDGFRPPGTTAMAPGEVAWTLMLEFWKEENGLSEETGWIGDVIYWSHLPEYAMFF